MKPRTATIALGALALAVVAPILAPSSVVLSAPDTLVEHVLATLALGIAFAIGFAAPFPSLAGVLVATVLEGAVRKWLVNDVVVFLLKDFLLVGVYAAVLPTLTRREWRRPWWAVAPIALLLVFALAYTIRSDSLGQALIGMRGYALYVPLLWVAPRLIDAPRRARWLLGLLIGLGVFEALLASLQTLTAGRWLNELVPGALPAAVVVNGISHLRPTGTMAHVGTLAAFMIFPVAATFAVIATERGGRSRWLAIAALAPLTWGVVYTASRTLLVPTVACALTACAYLLVRRRWGTAATAAATIALAVMAMTYQPFIGGAVREGGDSHVVRAEKYTYIDYDGKIKSFVFIVERGEPRATGGLAARGLGREPPTTPTAERPSGRFATTWRALGDAQATGHGTGTMSQGAQYLLEARAVAPESGYVKVAHELGLPALVPLAWMFAMFGVVSLVAVARAREVLAAALVAVAGATFVPLITLITFSIDYPPVAFAYYLFGGLALAWATGSRPVRAAPQRCS